MRSVIDAAATANGVNRNLQKDYKQNPLNG